MDQWTPIYLRVFYNDAAKSLSQVQIRMRTIVRLGSHDWTVTYYNSLLSDKSSTCLFPFLIVSKALLGTKRHVFGIEARNNQL